MSCTTKSLYHVACVCVQCLPVYPCIRVSAVFSLCHTLPRPATPRPPLASPSPTRPLPVWRPAVIHQLAQHRHRATQGLAGRRVAARTPLVSKVLGHCYSPGYPGARHGFCSPSPWTVASGVNTGRRCAPRCRVAPSAATPVSVWRCLG